MRRNLSKFLLIAGVLFTGACSKVPAGHVGVKVHLLGSDKGVDHEVLGLGRYWIGINEELYLFPTFQQNHVWQGKNSFSLQSSEGMQAAANVGISYHLDPDKIGSIFQRYRKGIDEITDIYIHNHIRDAVQHVSSRMGIEKIHGEDKDKFILEVQDIVKEAVDHEGIIVDKIYLTGPVVPPQSVVDALNEKVRANQRAQQRENELREEKAQSDKVSEKARGEAEAVVKQAEAEAKSIKVRAEAQAKANIEIAKSLSKDLIEYEKVRSWNGHLPQVVSDSSPLLNLK